MATGQYFSMTLLNLENVEGVQKMLRRPGNWSGDQILGSQSKYGILRNFGLGKFF